MYSLSRLIYALSGLFLCLFLVGWGGIVTTLEAGLAVPDWPTSFGSYHPFDPGYIDPENPDMRWWEDTPVMVEHVHRLLGALAGLWIVGLALWTFIADSRRWVKVTAATAVGLVLVQGLLGGLRVLWTSIDLAVAHAMGAQLFFCAASILTLSNSKLWFMHSFEESPRIRQLRTLSYILAGTVYIQILLGALLRHPGAGIEVNFITVHVVGSIISLSLIIITSGYIREYFPHIPLFLAGGLWIAISVAFQIILGIVTLIVLMYDSTVNQIGFWQLILTSNHLILGTMLMGSCACIIAGVLKPIIER